MVKKSKNETYIVDKILGKRNKDGVIHYRVHWKGYKDSEDTWEPIFSFKDSEYLLVNQFENKIIQKKNQKEGDYMLEAIIDKKIENEKTLYHVKWENYNYKQLSWEPYENLDGCEEHIQSYEEGYKVFLDPSLKTPSDDEQDEDEQIDEKSKEIHDDMGKQNVEYSIQQKNSDKVVNQLIKTKQTLKNSKKITKSKNTKQNQKPKVNFSNDTNRDNDQQINVMNYQDDQILQKDENEIIQKDELNEKQKEQLEKELEKQQDQEKQKEVDRQIESELENQRQKEQESEKQRQKEKEQERQKEKEKKELENQRQKEKEVQRQKEKEQERQKEKEKKELEKQRQKEKEQERQKQKILERQKEKEKKELEKQRQKEKEVQRQKEKEQKKLEKEKELENYKQREQEQEQQIIEQSKKQEKVAGVREKLLSSQNIQVNEVSDRKEDESIQKDMDSESINENFNYTNKSFTQVDQKENVDDQNIKKQTNVIKKQDYQSKIIKDHGQNELKKRKVSFTYDEVVEKQQSPVKKLKTKNLMDSMVDEHGPEDNITNMNSPEGYKYDEEEEVTSESSGTITKNHDKELIIQNYIQDESIFLSKESLKKYQLDQDAEPEDDQIMSEVLSEETQVEDISGIKQYEPLYPQDYQVINQLEFREFPLEGNFNNGDIIQGGHTLKMKKFVNGDTTFKAKWKPRINGFQPKDSEITISEIEKFDKDSLIEFYKKRLTYIT